MALTIVCCNCSHPVRVVYDLGGQTLEELLGELKGRKCPMCGHVFKGKQAGPITIKVAGRS